MITSNLLDNRFLVKDLRIHLVTSLSLWHDDGFGNCIRICGESLRNNTYFIYKDLVKFHLDFIYQE